MSNIDKQALREAAEKATPGRIGDRIDGSGSIKYQCFGNDGSLVLQTDHKNMEYGFIGGNSEADELFFRLCDPTTVLALLASLEAAEKRIEELEARTVTLPQYRNSPDMHTKQFYEAIGFNHGLDIFIEALRAAGIGVKGE
ncbi:TPA: ead/Ea22-like family protein [Escherichia coli]|nr:ead/Ea22-like family protein [Escherichia coli]